MCDDSYRPEDRFPPAFWTALNADDEDVLKRQNLNRKFDVSLVAAVAKRCGAGFPQVIVCRPVTSKGIPFPTVFWLTCPYLDRKCGEIESRQKIHDLENIFKEKIPEIIEWHKRYSILRLNVLGNDVTAGVLEKNRSIRDIILCSGVGGIDWKEVPFAVKCLHLQTATWLGWNYHPASDWLSEQIGSTECTDSMCMKKD